MPKLPLVSGADVLCALERLGFAVGRQRGSHIVMRRGSSGCAVPDHRELKVGTLVGVLKHSNLEYDRRTHAGARARVGRGMGRVAPE
jgi:predicted RNA binding protein YcfA (HicA-like mRNA interferase family)